MPLTVAAIKKLHARFTTKNQTTTRITYREAIAMFKKLKPDDEVTVLTRTEAREISKRGTPYPYNDCCVVKRRLVQINMAYEEAVNLQREREGNPQDFKAASRSWGRSIGLPFVHHVVEGEHRLYLSLCVLKTLGTEFYTWEMKLLNADTARKYVKPPRGKTRQSLDKEVRYRNYQLENVLAVGLKGPKGGEKLFVIDVASVRREAEETMLIPSAAKVKSKIAKQEGKKAGVVKPAKKNVRTP